MNDSKNIKYFPGLNALRFIAAAFVIVTHIELIKMAFGFHNYWHVPILNELGGLGVSFFFTLSGFLITYLLLKEKFNSSKINIGYFYMRRVLRIWPLYYLLLIIGFFVLPNFNELNIPYLQKSFEANFYAHLWSNIFILPNLSYSIVGSPVPHIGHLWSIGVEEQFYLFWPIIMKYSKNIFKSLIISIVVILVIKISVLFYSGIFSSDSLSALKMFLAMSKIENMMIGGVGAYLFFTNNKYIKYLSGNVIAFLSILFVLTNVYFVSDFFQDGMHLINSACFLIIILNASIYRKSIFRVDNIILNQLGNVSYGIYMYHFMIIPIIIYAFNQIFGIDNFHEIWFNILLYFAVFSITIIVSFFSYEFFEKKILKLKRSFS